MGTVSELVDIIRFLESKGLLCSACGQEATWFTGWEGSEGGVCKKHIPEWRKKEFREQRTNNRLYRRLLSRVEELLTASLGGGGSNTASGPGGTPAPELHPSDMGEKLSACVTKVAPSAKEFCGARRLPSRDSLGSDALGYLK
jgi:hypothetical protein